MKKIFLILSFVFSLVFVSCDLRNSSSSVVSNEMMKPRLIQVSSENFINECLPSVVAISAWSNLYNSVGSGVCVGDNGLIVTNYHVVSDADSIKLYLANGKICSAKLLWFDSSLDVALLKSEVAIPWLNIANEGSYSIGEDVVAIGTPLDLNFKHTVTKGVISAVNRTLQVDGENGYSQMAHLLQHDASINPGNSGGPLINQNGEIIGINTIKVDDAEGMGFAIVCDTITPIIENFNKYGSHKNGYLGVFGYDVSLEEFGSKSYGLKIVSIAKTSPLNRYFINEGDIILEFNGKKVKDYLMLKKELYKIKPDQMVTLKILHNGKSRECKVKLCECL
ncbi:MAG: trypsin-like peptidase domain-containing protein [Clostridia bacterium]|nr:trypsin-like peptidase domain-containing protein [Clostridia bacterium]